MKIWNKMNKTKAVLMYLEENGLNIRSEIVDFTDRYGTKSNYANYILIKGDNDNETKNN